MRRLVVSGLLLLLGVVQFAQATDYELTVDPSSKGLLKERSLTIYEQFGLMKPGDRIVSIAAAQLPVPNMSCKVYVGSGSNSFVLTPKGSLRNFGGEIRLGQGNPGSTAVAGALLVHVLPVPTDTRKGVIIKKVGGFFEAYPFLWILIGGGLLVGIGIAYFRINAQPAGTIPVYGKKAYEENIRDVKARLEQILATQEELVKKPPVLRSFRKQIDTFDKRLGHIESTSTATQQSQSAAASNIADIRKGLESLAAQEKSARQTLDDLLAKVDGKAEDQKRATDSFREEARANTVKLESLAASLATQLAEQTERSDAQSKALVSEIAKLQGRLAEADQRINDLKAEMSAADQANAERSGEVVDNVRQLKERLEQVVPDAVGALGSQIDEIKAGLQSAQKLSEGTGQNLNERLNDVSAQLKDLTKIPEGVSSLQALLAELLSNVEAVSESVSASSSDAAELRQGLSTAFADEGARVAEHIGTLGKDLAKLQAEVAKSQEAAEANGTAIAGLGVHIESLKSGLATKEQVDSLKEIPKSVAKLEESMGGSLAKALDAGLSKQDVKSILTAHEKLVALPAELSQMLQKSLEQKLAGLVAQSLTAKKGKDSDGHEQGATVMGEVAKQLLVEIEHQKTLELAFADLRTKLESVPDAISRLEQRLDTPASSTPSVNEELEPILVEINARLDAIPETVNRLAKQIEATTSSIGGARSESGEQTGPIGMDLETLDAVNGVPARLDKLDETFASASERWEQATLRLEEALQKVTLPNSAPLDPKRLDKLDERIDAASAQWESTNRRLDETVKAVSNLSLEKDKAPVPPQAETVEVRPALIVEATESEHSIQSEPEPIIAMHSEHAHTETRAAEMPSEAHRDGPTHLVIEAETTLDSDRAAPAVAASNPNAVRRGEQLWPFAGSFGGTWEASSSKGLMADPDPANAVRPLTPTETPGIEYEIGPMLYLKNRIIYAHGDSIRSFWPGQSERSLLLSHAVPSDPWRLLVLEDTLFCVQENRVETIDLAGWARSAAFAGVYLNQCATKQLWAGVRKAKIGLALEFRDSMGELVGDVHPLSSSLTTPTFFVSDGNVVYVGSEQGEVLKATPDRVGPFRKPNGGQLINFLITRHGPVAVTLDPEGIEIARFDSNGKQVASVKEAVAGVSGNMALLGDRLYMFDPNSCSLCACDLSSMTMATPIEQPGLQGLRRMIALDAGAVQSLLIAGCDSAGKLGSVFLLDPGSGAHLTLCSTNQPHVEAIFADGCPVVATSSSYQNIIRVFQPFIRGQAKAA